jgi:hypothetical protein
MSGEPGILLACDTLPENPWARDRLPAIRAALAGRRHEIVDIYDFGSVAAAHRLHRAQARGGFPARRIPDLNRRFRDRVLASGCRLAILGTADNFTHFLLPETLRELRAAGCFVVGILGDDEFTYDRNWPYVFLFDRVVAYVRPMVDRYNALRPGCCLYLPNSCHFPEPDFAALQVPEERKRHDVALFGSTFPARRRLVEELAARGVPLSLFGGRGWLASPRLQPYYRGYVASADFDRTVRESRIVLALLEDHLTGALHMNTKVWEAVRNGQMCVTSRYAPLVEDYSLVDGEDIVFYDTAADLATKLQHYLARPDERRRMAERLFRKIQTRFDYLDLYRTLFATLEQAAAGADELLSSVAGGGVTLLGAPAAADEAAGFPVWRFARRPGWRRRVAAEYRQRVTTSHVILAAGGYRYEPALSTWLRSGATVPGVGRLRAAGSETSGDETLIWQRDAFEAVVLRGSWWRRLRARAADVALPSVWTAVRPERDRLLAWLGAAAVRLHRAAWRQALRWRLAKTGP